jgi:transcriptional regulator with XRE-family HTH domain
MFFSVAAFAEFGENFAVPRSTNPPSRADLPILANCARLLRLYAKVDQQIPSFFDKAMTLANSLRLHRHRTGLSQQELGRLLGYEDESAVRKHERFQSMPPFLIALGYEVIFQVPISELFPGITETVALGIERRLDELSSRMRERGNAARSDSAVRRTLDWLETRRKSSSEI